MDYQELLDSLRGSHRERVPESSLTHSNKEPTNRQAGQELLSLSTRDDTVEPDMKVT